MIRKLIRSAYPGLLAAAWMMAAPASAAGDLAPLNGRWRGDGIELLIDTDRLQANAEPSRPFTRVPLLIRNVTGLMFFFSIGRETFLARAERETLSLTRLGSSGTVLLTRVR